MRAKLRSLAAGGSVGTGFEGSEFVREIENAKLLHSLPILSDSFLSAQLIIRNLAEMQIVSFSLLQHLFGNVKVSGSRAFQSHHC